MSGYVVRLPFLISFMIIRDAVLADLPEIVEIYNDNVVSCVVTADTESVTVESRVAWFNAHRSDDRPLWVLEIDGTITGWLGFQSFYGRPAYQGTVELSIYVAANYRRRGIGRLLLERAIAISPKLGITTLLGFIFADNHPSLQLFEQFGFQPWGCLPQVAKFADSTQDLVIVGKHLP
jgi:L-amino acid N-acyltransferase YncA